MPSAFYTRIKMRGDGTAKALNVICSLQKMLDTFVILIHYTGN
jgi:hypothetical protein